MQVYDVSLKLLLRNAERTFLELTGLRVNKWLDLELPKIESRRADLLGEAEDGSLLHIELQSTNDPLMALRMAEYCLGVYRSFGRVPRQVVLYVGSAPLRMPAALRQGGLRFGYTLVDARNLDGEKLIRSDKIGDNVLAILARVRDQRGAVRRIVRRLKSLEGSAQEQAISQLLTLAGLRGLEPVVEQELNLMPILVDLSKNKIFAKQFERVRGEAGVEANRSLLTNQIKKRFGRVSAKAKRELANQTAAQLEQTALRILDAQSVDELFAK